MTVLQMRRKWIITRTVLNLKKLLSLRWAEVLDIQSKAKYTYGQNQAYWYQNVIDTFSTQLPELAYGNMTAKEFCQKLTDAAKKN